MRLLTLLLLAQVYTHEELVRLLSLGEPVIIRLLDNLSPSQRLKVHLMCNDVRASPGPSGPTKRQLCAIEGRN